MHLLQLDLRGFIWIGLLWGCVSWLRCTTGGSWCNWLSKLTARKFLRRTTGYFTLSAQVLSCGGRYIMRMSCNTWAGPCPLLLPSLKVHRLSHRGGYYLHLLRVCCWICSLSCASIRQFRGISRIRQVLHGLEFLHEHRIIHENVKSNNVLVDNAGIVKISDPILASKLFKGASLSSSPKNRCWYHVSDL
jgi:hypothetical protein